MNELRFILRDETRVAHTRLDEALVSYDLADPVGLAKYLSIHYLARQHLTTMLNGLEALRDDTSRLNDLTLDLSTLGVPLPSWISPPDQTSKNPLGLIYVIAGSSLGSKVLYKNWALSTHPLVNRANLFVTHSKNNDIWTRFLAYIKNKEFSQSETKDIITSANFCFKVFEAANDQVKAKTYDD
jgi:heme oxygenase